jgi:putative ABC transport system permease protein
VRRGLGFTIAGVTTGLVGALGMGRTIAGLLYGVSSTDPETLVSVSVMLAAVSFVASYIPARRAAKVDPKVASRYE